MSVVRGGYIPDAVIVINRQSQHESSRLESPTPGSSSPALVTEQPLMLRSLDTDTRDATQSEVVITALRLT
jgi:hypothetical protein